MGIIRFFFAKLPKLEGSKKGWRVIYITIYAKTLLLTYHVPSWKVKYRELSLICILFVNCCIIMRPPSAAIAASIPICVFIIIFFVVSSLKIEGRSQSRYWLEDLTLISWLWSWNKIKRRITNYQPPSHHITPTLSLQGKYTKGWGHVKDYIVLQCDDRIIIYSGSMCTSLAGQGE